MEGIPKSSVICRVMISTAQANHLRERPMNGTLLKALVTLLPVVILFLGSAILFSRGKSWRSLLQLLGAGCLVLVVLTHVAEALHLFPWMHWGINTALAIISISAALSLVSPSFR